jgi:hypothetical protein
MGDFMAWYVVSYDLRKELTSTDWYRLYSALKSAVDYCWPLQSIWIVDTPLAPSGVIQTLINLGAIDDNDGIIVLEITGVGNFRRVVNEETAEWLNARLTKA